MRVINLQSPHDTAAVVSTTAITGTHNQLLSIRKCATLLAIFSLLFAYTAEINDTHVFNPTWHPHARFHCVWQLAEHLFVLVLLCALLWYDRMGVFVRKARGSSVKHTQRDGIESDTQRRIHADATKLCGLDSSSGPPTCTCAQISTSDVSNAFVSARASPPHSDQSDSLLVNRKRMALPVFASGHDHDVDVSHCQHADEGVCDSCSQSHMTQHTPGCVTCHSEHATDVPVTCHAMHTTTGEHVQVTCTLWVQLALLLASVESLGFLVARGLMDTYAGSLVAAPQYDINVVGVNIALLVYAGIFMGFVSLLTLTFHLH